MLRRLEIFLGAGDTPGWWTCFLSAGIYLVPKFFLKPLVFAVLVSDNTESSLFKHFISRIK
jgi:hypothetical protein